MSSAPATEVGVVPPYRAMITASMGLIVALIGAVSYTLPPYPMPAWFVGFFTVAPAEHWWYSLSDAHRQKWVYDVVTTIAEAIFPALLFVAFWLWTRPLRRGVVVPWLRAAILLGVVGLGSLAWYVMGWNYGMQYQGRTLVLLYVVVNILWFGLTTILIRLSNSFPSWWANLLAYFSLFVWIVTIAFPWLGEMP